MTRSLATAAPLVILMLVALPIGRQQPRPVLGLWLRSPAICRRGKVVSPRALTVLRAARVDEVHAPAYRQHPVV